MSTLVVSRRRRRNTDARATGGRPGDRVRRRDVGSAATREIGVDRGRSQTTDLGDGPAADVERERARRPGRRQHGAAAQVDVERVGRQAIDGSSRPAAQDDPLQCGVGEGDLDLLVRGVPLELRIRRVSSTTSVTIRGRMLPCARTSRGDAAPIPTERSMPAPASIRENESVGRVSTRNLAFAPRAQLTAGKGRDREGHKRICQSSRLSSA